MGLGVCKYQLSVIVYNDTDRQTFYECLITKFTFLEQFFALGNILNYTTANDYAIFKGFMIRAHFHHAFFATNQHPSLPVPIASFLLTNLRCEMKIFQVVFVNQTIDQTYGGVITVQDTLTSFAQTAAVQLPGGILVLSMNHADYSLSEISRLIEENHAKILSSVIKEDPLDPVKIRVTLKINQVDLSRIVATLERFNYKVIGRYQENKPVAGEKDRSLTAP